MNLPQKPFSIQVRKVGRNSKKRAFKRRSVLRKGELYQAVKRFFRQRLWPTARKPRPFAIKASQVTMHLDFAEDLSFTTQHIMGVLNVVKLPASTRPGLPLYHGHVVKPVDSPASLLRDGIDYVVPSWIQAMPFIEREQIMLKLFREFHLRNMRWRELPGQEDEPGLEGQIMRTGKLIFEHGVAEMLAKLQK